jgi:hypothetical protein
MSIKQKEIDSDGFKAKVATIYCDNTNLKMAEIIIRDCEKRFFVQAAWYGENKVASKPQEIKGCLSCSPIDTPSQKTAIINTDFKDNGEIPLMTVIVKRIK